MFPEIHEISTQFDRLEEQLTHFMKISRNSFNLTHYIKYQIQFSCVL